MMTNTMSTPEIRKDFHSPSGRLWKWDGNYKYWRHEHAAVFCFDGNYTCSLHNCWLDEAFDSFEAAEKRCFP